MDELKKQKRGLSNDDVVKNRQKANRTKDSLFRLFGKPSFSGMGTKEVKIKVMSNADRRKSGIEQDKDLPDYEK